MEVKEFDIDVDMADDEGTCASRDGADDDSAIDDSALDDDIAWALKNDTTCSYVFGMRLREHEITHEGGLCLYAEVVLALEAGVRALAEVKRYSSAIV